MRDQGMNAAHDMIEERRGLAMAVIGNARGCGDQNALHLGRFPIKRQIQRLFGGDFLARRPDFHGACQRRQRETDERDTKKHAERER